MAKKVPVPLPVVHFNVSINIVTPESHEFTIVEVTDEMGIKEQHVFNARLPARKFIDKWLKDQF